MAQSTDNTLSNQSGASFRTELNSILAAHLSSHKGSSEPNYITTGAFWIDDTSTPWIYKIYDGAASFGFLEVNPSTNNVTLINVKDGDARTEGASIGQIQDSEFHIVSSVSGTNTITGNLTPAITAYVEGLQIAFNPAGANTGAATIDLNSIGSAKALQINGQALVGGELATTDYVKAIYDGTAFQIVSPTSRHPLKGVRFPDQGELTISSGAITITGANHTIDTESDAASDDLDTINGGVDGAVLVLRAANAARTVVLKHNTGNIVTPDGADITLDETSKVVTLVYDAELSDWLVVSSGLSTGGEGFPNSGYATNRYYFGGCITGGSTDITLTANRHYFMPFVVSETATFTRISVYVATADVGQNARLGIYNMENGVPTTLVLDAGEISVGSVAVVEATISQQLEAGVYALTVVSDGTPQLQAGNSQYPMMAHVLGNNVFIDSASAGNFEVGGYNSHTYGALPSSFGGSITYTTQSALGPMLALRVV